MQTPVLVLDEPTAGLDAGEQAHLAQVLALLRQLGKTVLVILHDMDFVAENLVRVLLMHQGQVVLDAPVQDFFAQGILLETAGLAAPQITRLSWALGGAQPALRVEQFLDERNPLQTVNQIKPKETRMTHLKVGQLAPDFTLPSHLDQDIRLSDYRGKNVVLAFFPLAWTPVCSSQIPWYEADKAKFAAIDAQVFAISVDSVPCLKAWLDTFNGVTYPVLSDFWPHGGVARTYGVLRADGKAERALFIVDKLGVLRYIDIHDFDKQPDNNVLLAELRQIDPGAAAREPRPEKAVTFAPPTEKDVVMYCTSWCPGCRRARLWFNERGIQFTEIEINSVPGAAGQVMKWNNGNRTTPTFNIRGDVFANFDEQKLVAALKKHGIYG